MAEGWVPTDEVKEITASLERVTSGKVHIEELPIDFEHDAVPVEYQNPPFAHPTEMFMDVYSRPKYGEIDPTLLVAIVFPIFFGMIVGDVGYGLVFLAISILGRRYFKTEGWTQLLNNLRNAAFSTIIFGLLYSEFFGFKLPWEPFPFSRHLNIGGEEVGHGPDASTLLIISIWIGILHITLGRLISIVNHSRMDHGSHRTKAIVAQTGWLAFMWGLLIVIWSMFPIPVHARPEHARERCPDDRPSSGRCRRHRDDPLRDCRDRTGERTRGRGTAHDHLARAQLMPVSSRSASRPSRSRWS